MIQDRDDQPLPVLKGHGWRVFCGDVLEEGCLLCWEFPPPTSERSLPSLLLCHVLHAGSLLPCSPELAASPCIWFAKHWRVLWGKNMLYPHKISIWLLTFFSLKSVERTDSGKYWCQVENGGKKEESQQVWLIVEGKEE